MNSKAISSILLWQDYWPPRSKPAAEVANATPRRYSRPVVASPKHRLTAQGRQETVAPTWHALNVRFFPFRELTPSYPFAATKPLVKDTFRWGGMRLRREGIVR